MTPKSYNLKIQTSPVLGRKHVDEVGAGDAEQDGGALQQHEEDHVGDRLPDQVHQDAAGI